MKYSYVKLGTNPSDGADQILADRMLDFQVSLGLDFHPADGLVTDLGTNTDEWLYNSYPPNEDPTLGMFSTMPRNSPRMIGVG